MQLLRVVIILQKLWQKCSPDFYLFVITRWLVATPLSIDLWPNLKRYMDEMSHRPSIQAALAEEKEG